MGGSAQPTTGSNVDLVPFLPGKNETDAKAGQAGPAFSARTGDCQLTHNVASGSLFSDAAKSEPANLVHQCIKILNKHRDGRPEIAPQIFNDALIPKMDNFAKLLKTLDSQQISPDFIAKLKDMTQVDLLNVLRKLESVPGFESAVRKQQDDRLLKTALERDLSKLTKAVQECDAAKSTSTQSGLSKENKAALKVISEVKEYVSQGGAYSADQYRKLRPIMSDNTLSAETRKLAEEVDRSMALGSVPEEGLKRGGPSEKGPRGFFLSQTTESAVLGRDAESAEYQKTKRS